MNTNPKHYGPAVVRKNRTAAGPFLFLVLHRHRMRHRVHPADQPAPGSHMIYTLTAHWLHWLARHTTDPELASTLFETSWDIQDAIARRRRG